MLNCLFFRIFSSVSFVSLYQTKAQRSGFCLELRSKGAERGMPSPAGRYTRSGLCDEVVGTGFCPIFGIWQDTGTPATSQMRCWLLPNGRIFPAAAGLLCVGSAYCIRIFLRCPHVGATWAFSAAPHTPLAAGAKSRTQRRHAPHGALRVLGTPAGSIVPIVFTGRKSARSARLREIHRLPLLR